MEEIIPILYNYFQIIEIEEILSNSLFKVTIISIPNHTGTHVKGLSCLLFPQLRFCAQLCTGRSGEALGLGHFRVFTAHGLCTHTHPASPRPISCPAVPCPSSHHPCRKFRHLPPLPKASVFPDHSFLPLDSRTSSIQEGSSSC